MTEEDAKQKWCPMVNHYNARHEPCGNSFAAMGSTNDWRHTKCIGSSCMMWRVNRVWQDHPIYKVTFTGDHLIQQQVDVVDFGGYCGLAGKP